MPRALLCPRFPRTYRAYLRRVNAIIDRALPGLTVDDLPPRPYRQLWHDYVSPKAAARRALAALDRW